MEIKAKLNKPYSDNERMNFIVENNHKKGYEIKETAEALEAWGLDESELLFQTKQNKIIENDKLRDEALNAGVVYKDVLFDSDTDQKVNILATVSLMSDEDNIAWFGMDNQTLLCSKTDLINMGGLITQLHSFVWMKNAEIKEQIEQAETIEELEKIEIKYSKPTLDDIIKESEELDLYNPEAPAEAVDPV